MTTQMPAAAGMPNDGNGRRDGGVTTAAREQSAHVAQTVREQAGGVAQETAAQARDLLAELREQVRTQTDTQRQRLVGVLQEFEEELQQMASNGGGNGTATEVVRAAAQRLQQVRTYVDGGPAGGPDVLGDVRSFARRRPGTFLFGAVVLGVLAGRATRGAAAVRSEKDGEHGRHQTLGGPDNGYRPVTASPVETYPADPYAGHTSAGRQYAAPTYAGAAGVAAGAGVPAYQPEYPPGPGSTGYTAVDRYPEEEAT